MNRLLLIILIVPMLATSKPAFYVNDTCSFDVGEMRVPCVVTDIDTVFRGFEYTCEVVHPAWSSNAQYFADDMPFIAPEHILDLVKRGKHVRK